MTNEEAIAIIRNEYLCVDRNCGIERSCGKCDLAMPSKEPILKAFKMAIKALEQEPKADVLEKIRAEIEKVFCMSVVTNELRTPMEVKTEILQIIDKYKAESEE